MSDTKHFSREEWIDACHFHDVTEREVLADVARRVEKVYREAKASGRREAHPLVLLDLDSTLYEVQSRTFQILSEWTETEESTKFPVVRGTLRRRLKLTLMGYSIEDSFLAVGLKPDAADVKDGLEAVKKFWAQRFFTSRYLAYDRPYPGAAEFARKIHELGAEMVYLTGRDEPGMGEGTRANLVRDGFPWNRERTHLLLKRTFHEPDLDHKRNAADYIRTHGTLIASFENEPLNLTALYKIFPDAMHVFVDTVFSHHAAPVCQGLYRITGFLHN